MIYLVLKMINQYLFIRIRWSKMTNLITKNHLFNNYKENINTNKS